MLLCFYIPLCAVVYVSCSATCIAVTLRFVTSTMTKAKDSMIMQTLKRWLNKLCTWWPWQQTSYTDATQTTTSLNRGIVHAGVTSVAIEQNHYQAHSNYHQSTPAEICIEAIIPSQEGTNSALSAHEHHLAFLKYLVQRGAFNEDFPDGQLPEQYRK